MFSKLSIFFIALSLLSASKQALGRERWLEKDGRAVFLYPRRFGQEHPAVIDKLSAACPGQVCGTLAGQAITPLLAAQSECSQQDMADAIIDAAAQFDAVTQTNMIALAQEYRQAEKNTPPDFSVNPPANRNSVFCQKAPKNLQLNGLVQAQDPANDPELFFDPATSKTVKLGSQADTFPFGTSGNTTVSSAAALSTTTSSAAALSSVSGVTNVDEACETVQTVTVTVTAGNLAVATSSAVATSTASTTSIGNFGKCTVPQIQFGTGFDNRKETSFEPVDQTSYNHGSAQNIDIITQFICDTLANSCGADATAKATCATAKAAADTVTAKTGGQADAFNAVFGINTDFAAVAEVDDQGNVVSGTGSSSAAAAASTVIAASKASTSATASASKASSVAASSSSSAIGNFGSCTVPQIKFGTGFDNRKETSFEPVDQTSYSHSSAQNIDIITQFICDTLTNSCGADATAKATCTTAKAAADTVTAKTGGQADAFNAVFGISTDFAAVAAVDDQGNVVSGTGSSSAAAAVAASSTVIAASKASTSATASAPKASSVAASSSSSAIGNFGSCTVPQIKFGTGFDNRKETSFEPADQTSYNHGSAQNIDIITQFICDTLANSCGADATAKATCATAKSAADTVTAKTGGQADAFNAVFGISTDFAAVAEVDDQGNVVSGTGSSSAAAAASTVIAASKASTSATASASKASSVAASSSSSAIGNFGSCTVPQIKFGTGFDNRKETSFEPADQTSYNHGSAQNIDIITQFICDTLANSCGADATAKATCATAKSAADTVTAKTGGQADAFNAVFGISTDFAAVAEVDAQGNVVSGTGSSSAAAAASSTVTAASKASTSSTASASKASSVVASSSSSAIGNFGSCTVPQIKFGTGFDNRKETSFEPVDQTSYSHSSAQNIDIITQFICDTLANSCGADATAKATCATAKSAADTVTAKTGGQADAFNAVFGIKTNFASVAAVDDQGNVIASA